MNAWRKLQPHPFRLLLHLEWILLGLSAFKLVGFPGLGRPVFLEDGQWMSTIATKPVDILIFIGLLAAFGLLGLRLPTVRWMKCIYFTISLLLIGMITVLQGRGVECSSSLLIILLLRGSAMYGQHGRWTIATLVWLVYPLTLFLIMILSVSLSFVSGDVSSSVYVQQSQEVFPGFKILADGSARLNMSFTAGQVQQASYQIIYASVYYLADAFLTFGLIIVFVLLLVNSIFKERQGRRHLALAHEQLYQYSLQIEDQATFQERTRIAREIHDTLGHLLTAQSVMLENTALSLQTAPQDAEPFLVDSKRLGAEAMQELRQAVSMLRSDPLNGMNLETAIAHCCHEFSRITQIQPILDIQLEKQIPQRYQVAIYRIIEEALTNIQKHSQATQAWIHLEIQSKLKDSPMLYLQISDNGKGFNLQQNQTGFGLQGMRERVESLGGHLTIDIESGDVESGCQITARFPLLGATA
jgi:signal transduction histidine kinase